MNKLQDTNIRPDRHHTMRKGNLLLYGILLIATLLCMAALRTCGNREVTSPDNTPEQPVDHGDTLVIAIIHSPMSYYIYDDTIGGLNYDMLRLMSAEVNRPVKFVPVVSLDASLQSLLTGGCDVLASLPLTSQLRDKYLFTESVYLDRQVLVQRKDEKGSVRVKSVLDLANDTIHIEKNSPARERLGNLAEEIGSPVVITSHTDLSDEYLFLKVVQGEFKYAVINEKTARSMAAQYPQIDIDTPVGFTQFQAWVTRRSDTALHTQMDEWLQKFKSTDRYKQLLMRYSPSDTIINNY